MCLELESYTRRKIAKEPIPCWIIVKPRKDAPYRYVSFYLHAIIHARMTSELIVNEVHSVDIGLHSFANEEDALAFARQKRYCSHTRCRVLKCVIPKGAKYYKGKFWGNSSYASNKRNLVNPSKIKRVKKPI